MIKCFQGMPVTRTEEITVTHKSLFENIERENF
jgi:hypothetical protein